MTDEPETLTIEAIQKMRAAVKEAGGISLSDADYVLVEVDGPRRIVSFVMKDGSIWPRQVHHSSDCAKHNAPALEPARCDCGAETP